MNEIRAILIIALCSFPLRVMSFEPLGGDVLKREWIESHARGLLKVSPTLDADVLKIALAKHHQATEAGLTKSHLLTLVDFSKSSGVKRLWVFDLAHDTIVFHEWAAHGRNSGDHKNATRFSNKVGSLQSSLGLFLTGPSYIGKAFGQSLKLNGLQKDINDNALVRGIVLHGAPYVSEKRANDLGNVGRSFGCFSVRREIAKKLIDTIKDGSLMFAYHPQLNDEVARVETKGTVEKG